ncbi:MAG: helix-turn-helix domain-containing protein [Kordia sp.]|uniref:helix-turn-helix domain-containing protein n=1 Tax=Kordia sp. TaxID=1965332 RepID=UPI00385FD892
MKKLILFLCFFSIGVLCQAQKKDVLLDKAITLKKDVLDKEVDVKTAEILIRNYLRKAKKSKRKELIGRAYYLLSLKNIEIEKKLQYIDSTIFYTKDLKEDPEFPMKGYFFKGVFLDLKKKYQQAIDNYLLAESFAKRDLNTAYQHHIKFNIGILKRRIGKYQEALKLFKDCLAFKESKQEVNTLPYTQIVFQLSSTYYEIGQLDTCTAINKKGIQLALANNQPNLYYSFVVNEGINLTAKGAYKAAIDSIEKGARHLKKSSRVTSNFYLAKSYDALGEKEKALYYFKTIDTVFNETQNLFLPLRESYQYLIKNAKEKRDKELELYYTNQLLKVDSVIHVDYKYLSNTITKKYEIPELLTSRDELIADLKTDKKWILLISIILVLLVLSGLIYYYRKEKVYKKRYEAIIRESNISTIVEEEIRVKDAQMQPVAIDIDAHAVQEILQQLELFEQEKQYLANQISLKDAAKIVNTNSKYLSKIINSYKGKNFATYINDLRVDYLIEQMQHNPIYQKYTIRAIAKEGGFSSSEGFLRAFRKKTGLKPSYFVKKIRESQQK